MRRHRANAHSVRKHLPFRIGTNSQTELKHTVKFETLFKYR